MTTAVIGVFRHAAAESAIRDLRTKRNKLAIAACAGL
jgi:hypothetical protein